jgi:hypothetical protein
MGTSTAQAVSFMANGTTYWVDAYPASTTDVNYDHVRIRRLPPYVKIKNSTTITFNALGEYTHSSNALLTLEVGSAFKVVEVQTITGRVAEK